MNNVFCPLNLRVDGDRIRFWDSQRATEVVIDAPFAGGFASFGEHSTGNRRSVGSLHSIRFGVGSNSTPIEMAFTSASSGMQDVFFYLTIRDPTNAASFYTHVRSALGI